MKSDTWLKELYEANYDRLYRLAVNRMRQYAGHAADVQDILQDVFLEAARKNICNHPKPEAWLIVTTNNICKNYIRKNNRNELKKQRYAQEELRKSKQGSLLFVASETDKTAVSDIVITLEQLLPPEDLTLIYRYALQGQPIEQIGKEMHLSSNALRVRLFRIRKKIQKYFR